MRYKITFFLTAVLFSINIFAQGIDISDQLKDIESGKIERAKDALDKFKTKSPNDPSVIFLDAVLTLDGKQALTKYSRLADNYPKSKYADAALYRIYSYYYAEGFYNTAQKFLDRLTENYPDSPYLKTALNKTPEETVSLSPAEKEAKKEPVEDKVKPSEPEKDIPAVVFKYTIQAGAFLVMDNARKLKETFENAGYYADVSEKKVGGSIFNVVFVGKFQTESEAKTFLIDINKRHKLNGRVVPLD